MFAALSILDYGLFAFYLLVLVGMGWYFRREQHTSRDFFLAGRSMLAFPIGLSTMATCLAAWSCWDMPGEAYFAGGRLLIIPLAVWCCLPILTNTALPLYYRLGVCSIYEYLELRFDARTRLVGSSLFVLWRLLWLAGILYVPCRLLIVTTGLPMHTGWLVVALGAITTFYTFLGGMKTVIWTAVIQACVMAGGAILIVALIWTQLGGGPARVAEVARALGRTTVLDVSQTLTDPWTSWGVFPHLLLAVLSFFVADQLTAQRYLSARDLAQAKRSITWHCLSVTIVVPVLLYAGLALLAYYHDHPESMRPIWVANVDHATRRSVCDAQGVPLIPWNARAITPENIDQLVADGRLLRPNTRAPFADAADLVVTEAGVERVSIRQLAMRRPPPDGLKQGEIILNEQAGDELLPHFVTEQHVQGLTGWWVVAVLAASMCVLGSGIHSMATLLVVDFHRQLGIVRRLLARRRAKPGAQDRAADELRFGRLLVLASGSAVTGISLVLASTDDALVVVVEVASPLAGPLLAVFLLGMFTRRTTAASAVTALAAGAVFTLSLAAARHGQALAWFWPSTLNSIWFLTCGVAFSGAWGYVCSFVLGKRRTDQQLRGLVVGLGPLGVREPEEASIAIPDVFDGFE